MLSRPPTPTPFPYTTLFRSLDADGSRERDQQLAHLEHPRAAAVLPRRDTAERLAGAPVQDLAADDVGLEELAGFERDALGDRKSTRLNSSHSQISYAVFCLK